MHCSMRWSKENIPKLKLFMTPASWSLSPRRLHEAELILDTGAITTMILMAPCHDGSICQNRSKRVVSAMNLLHIPELLSDFGAISTVVWTAPCHHTSIRQDRSKSSSCVANPLNIPQLILDCGAVTTIVWMAP